MFINKEFLYLPMYFWFNKTIIEIVDKGRIMVNKAMVIIIKKTGFVLVNGAITATNNPINTNMRLVFDFGLIGELLKSDSSQGAINIVGIRLDMPAPTKPIINTAEASLPANGSSVLTMSMASSTGLPITYKVPAAQTITAKLSRNIILADTIVSVKAFLLSPIPQPFAFSEMLRQYNIAELNVVPAIPATINVALGSFGI